MDFFASKNPLERIPLDERENARLTQVSAEL